MLGEMCPDIKLLIENTSDLSTNETHVNDMRNIFNLYRRETVTYEFLTQKEMKSFT
jgi:hypothetical protein